MDLKPALPPAVVWGRNSKARLEHSLGGLGMILLSPAVVIFYWISLEHFGGSLTEAAKALSSRGWARIFTDFFPCPSWTAAYVYVGWVLFQALLFTFLPGATSYGQRTPGGHLLKYTTNGLAAWCTTHIAFAAAVAFGYLDPAFVARNWQGLLVAANCYGVMLAVAALVKGYWAPSYPRDRKLTGSIIFDFWAGVDLNPRFGSFDWKLFHNGRPGIVAWTLIDLSWAAYQYQTFGYVSKSMIVATILHAVYVLDLFYNEDWYLRTPDISHDHFGFYLAWGDSVWLPTFYTLQTQYLARHPTHISNLQSAGILALGLAAYGLFRSANDQRNSFRQQHAVGRKVSIWGSPASYILCSYHTKDGKQHSTALLTSGWWGLARQVNYLADMVQSWAWCAPCGFGHFLPWSYFFFICVLLHHRIARNDGRGRNKYGKQWEEYCRLVPYKLVPGVY